MKEATPLPHGGRGRQRDARDRRGRNRHEDGTIEAWRRRCQRRPAAGGVILDIRCVMRDATSVRTTLDVDDDVLLAAKQIAANRGTTAGRVLSDLARQALQPKQARRVRNGVPLMPRRSKGSVRPNLD